MKGFRKQGRNQWSGSRCGVRKGIIRGLGQDSWVEGLICGTTLASWTTMPVVIMWPVSWSSLQGVKSCWQLLVPPWPYQAMTSVSQGARSKFTASNRPLSLSCPELRILSRSSCKARRLGELHAASRLLLQDLRSPIDIVLTKAPVGWTCPFVPCVFGCTDMSARR